MALPEPNSRPRLIAFYLPQYHPTPENDQWWGKGFTEWSNVTRAKPLFPGHYQPHLPGELGFYDLRLPSVRQAQADLARQYGIYGFCYYHYWFEGRRLLHQPLDDMLSSGQPDFPFCLCWANESWTRRWDSLDNDALVTQRYSPEDDLAHIRWLLSVCADPRYIRIEGKPLVMVYKVRALPDPARTAAIWREEAARQGLPGLYLCKAETFADAVDPALDGFDAMAEFPPHAIDLMLPRQELPYPAFTHNRVFDYRAYREVMLNRPEPGFVRHPGVTLGWDNSSRRRQGGAFILQGATPTLYQGWLAAQVARVTNSSLPVAEKLIFINAWNEWAESTHLEPDLRYGRAYLEATRQALEADGLPNPAAPAAFPPPPEMVSEWQRLEEFYRLQFDQTAQTAYLEQVQTDRAGLVAHLHQVEQQYQAQTGYTQQLETRLKYLENSRVARLNRLVVRLAKRVKWPKANNK